MRRPPEPLPPETPEQIVALMLDAYLAGAFPMADAPSLAQQRRQAEGRIRWFSPDPRAILPLEPGGLHIPGGVKKALRRRAFRLTADACFPRVLAECAVPSSKRGESWLSPTLSRWYAAMHDAGFAHSLEVWTADDALVGGIYGVCIGAAFFAESMFSRPELGGEDASNIALVRLVQHLQLRGYELLDVQLANQHTQRFGVIEIPRRDYLKRLHSAVLQPDRWAPPDFTPAR